MRFRPLQIEIPADKPFVNDKLGRLKFAEQCTSLLNALDHSSAVLAIDGAWGTGKTTFIKMWQQHLQNAKYECVYYNAWECDFFDDPLASIIGELEVFGKSDTEKSHGKTLKNLKFYAAKLAMGGLPLLTRLATAGLIDLKNDDIEKVVEDVVAASAESSLMAFTEKQMDRYFDSKRTVAEFKKVLRHFVDEIMSEEDKPLVYFVDELDRCRPTYAIETLERIKHLFFGVQLKGSSRTQLNAAIGCQGVGEAGYDAESEV